MAKLYSSIQITSKLYRCILTCMCILMHTMGGIGGKIVYFKMCYFFGSDATSVSAQ